jgi:predicted NUDIX family phosphoesterase
VDAYKIYLEAVKREVAEEVSVNSAYTDKIVALLNDESNEVGSVHLGIVHYWMLSEPKVSKKEQMITQMSFMTPVELQEVKDTMETWSQLCLSGLEEMAERVKSA